MSANTQVIDGDADHPTDRERINRVLGIDKKNGSRRLRRRIILFIVLAGLVTSGGFLWKSMTYTPPPSYKTEAVSKGDLTILVTATGTVEPRNTVEVGAEISGLISKVYVDYNDPVHKGQLLAELDKAYLKAAVQQAEANLAAAKAKYNDAVAAEQEAELQAGRGKELYDKGIDSREDYDTLQSALVRAQASVDSAQAQITVAQAALESANTNLGKASIRSPINGVVLSRKVEPGQAVAAAMSTPVLFEIAEDLKLMELHVNVDEADIGSLQQGQTATFTVDAYPDRVFNAVLKKIYNTPTEEDNVITYETILTVDNPDLALRPGMTCRVSIVTETIKDALLVPTSAFRFQPSTAAGMKTAGGKNMWILRDGRPMNIPVQIGASDGSLTVVYSKELKVGDEVLVGTQTGSVSSSSSMRPGPPPF
jgi:HlyD family secretion protein